MVHGSTRSHSQSQSGSPAGKTEIDGTIMSSQSTHRHTALVYDPALTAHCPWLPHQKDEPEVPLRVETVMSRLETMRLTAHCDRLQGRNATMEELLSVHTREHIERLEKLNDLTEDCTKEMEAQYDSVYLSPFTHTSSLMAAGCVCEAANSVLAGKHRNAVAVVRPPGHHAYSDRWSGFCFLNNVAVGVRQAQKQGMTRILILDWDIHHGNGTQAIFEDDPGVLFISLHRYDHGKFYPSSEAADPEMVGKGDGEGYSVNIAWNESGLKDTDYRYAFQQVVMPIAKEFDPEIVFVSAGFDGAEQDPLGMCDLKPRIYNYMTTELQKLADGKVVIVLEGGYNCDSTAACMSACVEALVGKQPHSFARCKRGPSELTKQSVELTKWCHREFWPCLPTDGPMDDSTSETVITSSPEPRGDSSPLTSPQPSPRPADQDSGEQRDVRVPEEEATAKEEATPDVSIPAVSGSVVTTAGTAQTSQTVDNAAAAVATAGHALAIHTQPHSNPSEDSSLASTAELLSQLQLDDGPTMFFAVTPKTDCPHVAAVRDDFPGAVNMQQACEKCDETYENWICLHCHNISCGRAINEHMKRHNQRNPDHHICVSFADLSAWCYACDSYIECQKILQPKLEALHRVKFGVKSF